MTDKKQRWQSVVANFARMPLWSAEEFTALSAGHDPRIVHAKSAGFFFYLKDRMNFLRRGIRAGQIKREAPPAAFIKWAQSCGLEVDDELVKAVFPPSPRMTTALETAARKDMRDLVANSPDRLPKKRAEIISDLRARHKGLTKDAADRAYESERPEAWKRGGRPRSK